MVNAVNACDIVFCAPRFSDVCKHGETPCVDFDSLEARLEEVRVMAVVRVRVNFAGV